MGVDYVFCFFSYYVCEWQSGREKEQWATCYATLFKPLPPAPFTPRPRDEILIRVGSSRASRERGATPSVATAWSGVILFRGSLSMKETCNARNDRTNNTTPTFCCRRVYPWKAARGVISVVVCCRTSYKANVEIHTFRRVPRSAGRRAKWLVV